MHSQQNNAPETTITKKKEKADKLNEKITAYDNAVKTIAELEKAKQKRADNAKNWNDDHKNQYLELMAFWDFLQTGNTKSMFHLSTKKLQEKMNTKSDVNGKEISLMEQNYETWKTANGYAA